MWSFGFGQRTHLDFAILLPHFFDRVLTKMAQLGERQNVKLHNECTKDTQYRFTIYNHTIHYTWDNIVSLKGNK